MGVSEKSQATHTAPCAPSRMCREMTYVRAVTPKRHLALAADLIAASELGTVEINDLLPSCRGRGGGARRQIGGVTRQFG